MSRSKNKDRLRVIAEKLGKRPRGAANVLRRNPGPATHAEAAEAETIYILEHLYEAASDLFDQHPETHRFSTNVPSYRHVDARFGPNGEVAMLPTVEVTFTKDTPAHWWFDGPVAFIEGELPRAVRVDMLETEEGRVRVAEAVRDHIRNRNPSFANRLAHLEIKGGYQRDKNLVFQVSLCLVDEQELAFTELMVALEKAHLLASIEMGKGALNEDLTLEPKRQAIMAARDALGRVVTAAVTPRQRQVAERSQGHEALWKSWEQSLDRVQARHGAPSPGSFTLAHLTVDEVAALRREQNYTSRLTELRRKSMLSAAEQDERDRLQRYLDALRREWSRQQPFRWLGGRVGRSLEIDWAPDEVRRPE